jgi:hypothetical protein
MKIYVASSWKNAELCKNVGETLRKMGHDIDVFCEERKGRTIFSFDDVPNANFHDGITMLQEDIVQKAFAEDKKWLDWADAVVMILPCGNSAHLEAGYAKGQNKKLYIVGDFPQGEFDVMYGFADGLFPWSQWDVLGGVLND